jgi:hypothetical protein
MLLAIAFASTVSSNTPKTPKKESPLFGIRTRGAIRKKIGDLFSRFIGERIFFLPFQWLRNIRNRDDMDTGIITGKSGCPKTLAVTSYCHETCYIGCK